MTDLEEIINRINAEWRDLKKSPRDLMHGMIGYEVGYAAAIADAANLIESDPTGGSIGKQRTIDAIRRLAAKE